MMELSPEEVRVLGALVEKQLTTPQQYPLTVNALVGACNQSSSRNPIVSYGDRLVEATLAGLKEKRLVRFVHPSHGRSVTRYRQVLEEVLSLEVPQLALLAVLFLRGPQTPGELRGRTERMADFAGLEHLEEELDLMASREEPLVTRLRREPGRKEVRYAHLLGGHVATAGVGGGEAAGWDTAPHSPSPPSPSPPPDPSHAGGFAARTEPASDGRFVTGAPRDASRAHQAGSEVPQSLASQLAVLRAEVAALRRDLDEVLARLLGPER